MSTAVQKPQKSAELAEQMEEVEDINDIDLPMRIPDIPMMTPGRWNNIEWTADEIEMALNNTTFESQMENEGEIEQNNALFFEHDDRDARAWIGEVENIRMEEVEGEGKGVVGDLVIVDEEAAKKLAYGAKFGISAKVSGRTDGDVMRNFSFENFSLVLNPAVKTTFINSEMEDVELQDMEIHEPDFSSTDDREWNTPDMEDFDTDDLSEIDDHFILSASGFPPEKFTDLKLPVVEPDGTLNLNALQNAKARANQVSGLEGDNLERVVQIINRLANENFEDADFEPLAKHKKDKDEEMDDGEENSENDNSSENIMGDNTPMTEDDVEPETDDSPEGGEDEVEESAESVDMESLKDELLSDLKEELQDDEESEDDVEDEDVEDDVEEDEVENEELSEFEEFLNENPDLSPKEAADAFEEAQKTPEEKAEEKIAEVKQEMASHIEDLKSEIEELSESEPARVSKASGQTYEELSEKVQEQDRSDLRKGVMRKMLDDAGASHLYK